MIELLVNLFLALDWPWWRKQGLGKGKLRRVGRVAWMDLELGTRRLGLMCGDRELREMIWAELFLELGIRMVELYLK